MSDLSFEQLRSRIVLALDELHPFEWTWIVDIYPDHFVFEMFGFLFRNDYQLIGDTVEIIGEAVEVIRVYVPVEADLSVEQSSVIERKSYEMFEDWEKVDQSSLPKEAFLSVEDENDSSSWKYPYKSFQGTSLVENPKGILSVYKQICSGSTSGVTSSLRAKARALHSKYWRDGDGE